MIRFKDFVPKKTSEPRWFQVAEFETFEEAVAAANQWINEHQVRVVQLETVVLPNIWQLYEEGTTDASLGTETGKPSHWHQFLRCWYETD